MAKWLMCKTLGAACLGLSMMWSAPAAFALADIIETPARQTDLAPTKLLNDAVRVGDRIVAVGERGHIIYSDDGGHSWEQGKVPVSVTLTAVDFGTETHGWAVGHSGVVLYTADAGENWTLQLTGMDAAKLAIASKEAQIAEMEQRIEEAPESEKADLEWALDDVFFTMENIQSDMDIGPVNPLLGVWFEDDQHGFVVGAYGMILRTEDGGQTWADWASKIQNTQSFHLNNIARVAGGALVIVGEAGQIHVSDDNGDTWTRRESAYQGSLFGVTGTGKADEILVFGLRGNMLLSSDLGVNWRMVPSNANATLNSGVVADDGRITLVGNGGAVLMSNDGAESFGDYFRSNREGIMSVVPVADTHLLIVGEGGATLTDAHGKNLQ